MVGTVAVDEEIFVGCLGRTFESLRDCFADGGEESEVCLDVSFIEKGDFVGVQVKAEQSGFETPKVEFQCAVLALYLAYQCGAHQSKNPPVTIADHDKPVPSLLRR